MKQIYTYLLLPFIFFQSVHTQPLDLDFRLLDKDPALSNSNATCITQDAYGYIWIGTINGLNRYDGYNMKSYFSVSNDSLSLPDNHINTLFIDSKGTLWIGTNTGLCKYLPECDNFKNYILSPVLPQYEVYKINSINENNNQEIFFGIYNHIIRYTYNSDSISLFLSVEKGEISSFEFDSLNNIWIGTYREGGLYHADEHGKIKQRYQNDSSVNSINSNSILDLVIHKKKLWIATNGGGINCFDLKRKNFHYYFQNSEYEKYARYTYIDHDGRLWIGDHTGIKLYDEQQDQFYSYYNNPDDPKSLPANALSIFQDVQGNYWTLHSPGGVAFSEVKKGFKIFGANPNDYWHTSDENIASIEEDYMGNLWMSNPHNGIDIFYWPRAKTYRFHHEHGNRNSLGAGATFDMCWESNIMWIASNRGGIQYINLDLDKFIGYLNNPADTTTIACNDVRSITSDSEGNIWLSVHGKGVDKFDKRNKTFFHYTNDKNNLSNDWTFEVLADSYGEIWVATAWGLSRLKKNASKFINYYSNPADTNSLNGNEITTVFQDATERIWVGTTSGLNLYNRENDNFSRIGGYLRNKYICAVLDDADRTLWVTTQEGLYSYNPSKESFRRFDEDDGLPSTEFNPRSSFKNLHNNLFFGSVKGAIIFNPKNIKYNKMPPTVMLTNFTLFHQEVTGYGNDSILDKKIGFADRVLLEYNQNMVTFEFTAINMIQSHKNQYAYMMKGFDNNWRYIGTKREATYTNLSPGTYTFKVKASNNDGYWNEEGVSIKVIVNPPWWMTWWFRVLLVLTIILSIAGIVVIRNRQLIIQKVILTEKVKSRTQELREKNKLLKEQADDLKETNFLLEERQEEIITQSEKLQELNSTKDKFFSIIAHDLTSPFNTILGFTELLSVNFDRIDNREKIKIASTINDSAKRVYGLLDNLLKWARSQTDGMQYSPRKVKIESIIIETIKLYEIRMKEKNIELVVDNKYDIAVTADIEMLKTIMRNLVSNAIKFTDRGGQLVISAEPNTNNALISVTDTGIGMEPEMIDQLFDMKTSFSTQGTDGEIGSGIGLMLTRDFVERNKGQLSVDSTVGKGTTFRFTVPLA